MRALKRNQPWPENLIKGGRKLMQINKSQTRMLGYVVGDYFYTPDIGRDSWEIWQISDLTPIN